jgi:hypothetical protein
MPGPLYGPTTGGGSDWFAAQPPPPAVAAPPAPGAGPTPGGPAPDPLQQLQTSPGYQFRLSEGAKALERSAAARGTLLTGGTLKGLQRYAQDYASGEYQNRYNQLFGLAQLGQNSAAMTANQNANYANNAGNLITQQGNAQSAGTMAGANAASNAINSGQNLAQMYYLSRLYGGGTGTVMSGGAGGYPGAT